MTFRNRVTDRTVNAVPDNNDPAPESADANAEEWTKWPENCRNFRRGQQNPLNVRHFFQDAAQRDSARWPYTRVFHMTEYGGKETDPIEHSVNEEGLGEYLTNQHARKPNVCKLRLFFACADRGWHAVNMSYMRRWWSHYSVPMDVAVSFANESTAVFRTFAEDIDVPTSASPKHIIHLWLGCHPNLLPPRREELHYCEHQLLERLLPETNGASQTFFPSIYIQYDTFSKETTILSLDYPALYAALQRTCKGAFSTGITTDPFVFLVTYLDCLLAAFRKVSSAWSRHVTDDQEKIPKASNDYSYQLQNLSRNRKVLQRTARTLRLLGDLVLRMHEEHSQFAKIEGCNPDPRLFKSVASDLLNLTQDIHTVAREVESCDVATANLIDVLLGLTQIRNGESMRTIAEENQKQAVAAQAIATATRKDSEIMKTITVVTLIYLPATFVCTLLSMGMFEWPSDGESGGVRIARGGWIYLLITIPLTLMTCSIAWWWYSRSGARAPSDDLEKRIK